MLRHEYYRVTCRCAFREFRKLFHVRSLKLPFLLLQLQPPAYVLASETAHSTRACFLPSCKHNRSCVPGYKSERIGFYEQNTSGILEQNNPLRSFTLVLMHLSHVHYPTDFSLQIVILNDYTTLIFMKIVILWRQITRKSMRNKIKNLKYSAYINENVGNYWQTRDVLILCNISRESNFYLIRRASQNCKIMFTKILTSIENEILRGIDFVSVSGFASCHTVAGTKRSYYNRMKSRSFVSILRTTIRCKDKAYLALIEQSTAAISLLPNVRSSTELRADCNATDDGLRMEWIVTQVYEWDELSCKYMNAIFSEVKGNDIISFKCIINLYCLGYNIAHEM